MLSSNAEGPTSLDVASSHAAHTIHGISGSAVTAIAKTQVSSKELLHVLSAAFVRIAPRSAVTSKQPNLSSSGSGMGSTFGTEKEKGRVANDVHQVAAGLLLRNLRLLNDLPARPSLLRWNRMQVDLKYFVGFLDGRAELPRSCRAVVSSIHESGELPQADFGSQVGQPSYSVRCTANVYSVNVVLYHRRDSSASLEAVTT